MNSYLARNFLYRPVTWLRGEPVFRLLRRYEQSQWWSTEELRASQEAGLRRILRYAGEHSPFYKKQLREQGLVAAKLEASDLERLRPLQKLDLVESGSELVIPRLPGTYSLKTTGGSTGIPVTLRKSRFATAAEQAVAWRSYAWYGVEPGDRQARFWGTPITGRGRLRTRAIDWVLNRDRFSAFAFTREDLRGYYDRLVQARPVWIYGYVSMLVQFASYCIEEGLGLAELGIRSVVTTSEALSEPDRELIARGFGAPVYNEYGCGEVGAILYECPEGSLHLMAENLFLELVPAPTPEKPDACRILVTDLHNRATPLLRYDIADRVVSAPECVCGRGLPAFREVFGRAYDFVEAEDGTRYHGEFFMYHLEQARDAGVPILQAQFVQDRVDQISVRAVPGLGYRDCHGKSFAEALERESGGRFAVTVHLVDALSRERSGKIRLIVALPNSMRGGPA